MHPDAQRPELDRFIDLLGREAWQNRIDAIVQAQPVPGGEPTPGNRDVLRRHAIEVSVERQRRPGSGRAIADRRIAALAAEAVRLHQTLPRAARRRFEARLDEAMLDGQSLTPLFHLLRTAWLHRRRGHEVAFSGLLDDAPFDLTVSSGDERAEIACTVVSAEGGRSVHHGAWLRLLDRVDPDLQLWLSTHPGRYLLKITLPQGLRVVPADKGADDIADDNIVAPADDALASLHRRITAMLGDRRRSDQDERAVLRLDPLVLSASRPAGNGPADAHSGGARMLAELRASFGPEAELAVTEAGQGVFAIAAHAGGANDVPAAVCRHMAALAPARLTGSLPGILAVFVDDIELGEWRRLEREMTLEGAVRHFLTTAPARAVVTVACTSRHELFHPTEEDGEHRYRNPGFRKPGLDRLHSSTASTWWAA